MLPPCKVFWFNSVQIIYLGLFWRFCQSAVGQCGLLILKTTASMVLNWSALVRFLNSLSRYLIRCSPETLYPPWLQWIETIFFLLHMCTWRLQCRRCNYCTLPLPPYPPSVQHLSEKSNICYEIHRVASVCISFGSVSYTEINTDKWDRFQMEIETCSIWAKFN